MVFLYPKTRHVRDVFLFLLYLAIIAKNSGRNK